MKRTALLCIVAFTCFAGAGVATAQPSRDTAKDTEDGRVQQPADSHTGLAQDTAPKGQQPPAPSSGTNGAMPTRCMPPGMPAPDQLVNVGALALLVPVEGRESAAKVDAVGFITKDHLAEYREGEGSLDLIAYYVEGTLAAVDDHPDDATQPELVDTGMMSGRGTVLPHGTPSCQWVRITPRPPGGSATIPGTRI
jgi:hypothetical protein